MTILRKRASLTGRAQRSFDLGRAWLRSALAGGCLFALALPAFAGDRLVPDKTAELRKPTSVQQTMAQQSLPPKRMVESRGLQLASLPPTPLRKPAPPPGVARSGLATLAEITAVRYGVEPNLVHAVILTESLYRPDALSHKGAMGLMQLMPATARLYGLTDPWDPRQNIDGGVRHLRHLLRHYNDTELALAAYNAGKQAVARYGNAIPPFKETQTYVARATSYLAKLRGGASVDRLRRTGAGVSTRLSGWGVIFGSFHKRDQAHEVLKRNRRIIGSNLKGGRPVVHKRQFAGLGPYNAMIVGLKQEGAITACRSVRQSGGYCLAIPPKQLRDKRAIWR